MCPGEEVPGEELRLLHSPKVRTERRGWVLFFKAVEETPRRHFRDLQGRPPVASLEAMEGRSALADGPEVPSTGSLPQAC